MTIVSKDHSTRNVQYRAFDEFPKDIQDALNYSNLGFSTQDILYLHSLYINNHKTVEELVKMIDDKDAWATVTTQWVRANDFKRKAT